MAQQGGTMYPTVDVLKSEAGLMSAGSPMGTRLVESASSSINVGDDTVKSVSIVPLAADRRQSQPTLQPQVPAKDVPVKLPQVQHAVQSAAPSIDRRPPPNSAASSTGLVSRMKEQFEEARIDSPSVDRQPHAPPSTTARSQFDTSSTESSSAIVQQRSFTPPEPPIRSTPIDWWTDRPVVRLYHDSATHAADDARHTRMLQLPLVLCCEKKLGTRYVRKWSVEPISKTIRQRVTGGIRGVLGMAPADTERDLHREFKRLKAPDGRALAKIALVMGKTGSGKSRLIDALANYYVGVLYKDTFRFRWDVLKLRIIPFHFCQFGEAREAQRLTVTDAGHQRLRPTADGRQSDRL